MIYFIRNGDYIKIGVANNPWERLSKFQVGSPVQLELLAVAPGSFDEEYRYHSMFSQHRARGEWFHARQPVLDFIQATRERHHKIQERPKVSLYSNARARAGKKRKKVNISAADAVRLVVNTAVKMAENEPVIDVRSVESSSRGPGILIWIPGYVDSDGTIIEAAPPADGNQSQVD